MGKEDEVTTVKISDLPEYISTYSYDPSYTSTISSSYTEIEIEAHLWGIPEKPKSLLERIISYLKGLIK